MLSILTPSSSLDIGRRKHACVVTACTYAALCNVYSAGRRALPNAATYSYVPTHDTASDVRPSCMQVQTRKRTARRGCCLLTYGTYCLTCARESIHMQLVEAVQSRWGCSGVLAAGESSQIRQTHSPLPMRLADTIPHSRVIARSTATRNAATRAMMRWWNGRRLFVSYRC